MAGAWVPAKGYCLTKIEGKNMEEVKVFFIDTCFVYRVKDDNGKFYPRKEFSGKQVVVKGFEQFFDWMKSVDGSVRESFAKEVYNDPRTCQKITVTCNLEHLISVEYRIERV